MCLYQHWAVFTHMHTQIFCCCWFTNLGTTDVGGGEQMVAETSTVVATKMISSLLTFPSPFCLHSAALFLNGAAEQALPHFQKWIFLPFLEVGHYSCLPQSLVCCFFLKQRTSVKTVEEISRGRVRWPADAGCFATKLTHGVLGTDYPIGSPSSAEMGATVFYDDSLLYY